MLTPGLETSLGGPEVFRLGNLSSPSWGWPGRMLSGPTPGLLSNSLWVTAVLVVLSWAGSGVIPGLLFCRGQEEGEEPSEAHGGVLLHPLPFAPLPQLLPQL